MHKTLCDKASESGVAKYQSNYIKGNEVRRCAVFPKLRTCPREMRLEMPHFFQNHDFTCYFVEDFRNCLC